MKYLRIKFTLLILLIPTITLCEEEKSVEDLARELNEVKMSVCSQFEKLAEDIGFYRQAGKSFKEMYPKYAATDDSDVQKRIEEIFYEGYDLPYIGASGDGYQIVMRFKERIFKRCMRYWWD